MLALAGEIYDELIEIALDAVPREACGVLGGEYGPAASTVEAIEPLENVAGDPRFEYAFDPECQYAVMDDLRTDGLDVVGFYHSHPTGPPAPSSSDVTGAAWPRRSFLIVSLGTEHPFVGSWRWDAEESRFVREAIRLA